MLSANVKSKVEETLMQSIEDSIGKLLPPPSISINPRSSPEAIIKPVLPNPVIITTLESSASVSTATSQTLSDDIIFQDSLAEGNLP